MDLPLSVMKLLEGWQMIPLLAEEKLEGGLISLTRRLHSAHGTVVVKQSTSAPEDMYAREAEGLSALSVQGGPLLPRVLSVASDHLILEDFGKHNPGPGFWEEFGRRVAVLHSHQAPQYGFQHDNYLGILLMDNSWSEDGYDFFIRTRMLRFLPEPLAETHLTEEDRKGVERIAAKLPSMIPHQPPSLIHGDLWTSNILVAPDGQPAVIDPAVYYGWPEAELSMTFAYDGVGAAAFDAYRESHPLEPGWNERFEILNIRELLSMVAHTGNEYGTVGKLRELLAKFA